MMDSTPAGRGGYPDESGNSWLISNKELSSTTGVGCSRCWRTAKGLTPKAEAGRRFQCGWRLEEGVALGLFCPSTI